MKRLAAIILTSILVFASYIIAANQRETPENGCYEEQ